MNCEQFAKHLPLLISGEVNEELRDASENHMQTCTGCLKIFAGASQAQFALTDGDAFTQSVMQATTPNICVKSEELLGDFLDCSLDEEQQALLLLHLDSCAHCHSLYENLQVIATELSLIAERQPPQELLGRVLQQTVFKQRATFSFPESMAQLYRQFLLRPRFALEASFAVTLLWSLAFGVPTSFISTSFAEQSIVAEQSPLRKAWTQTKTNIESGLARLEPEVSNRATSIKAAPSRFFQDSVNFVQGSGEELWQQFSSFLDALGSELSSGQDLTE